MKSIITKVAVTLVAFSLAACGEMEEVQLVGDGPQFSEKRIGVVASALTKETKTQRAETIRDAAARAGWTNGVLLAGMAQVSTGMAHCWEEATWACKGPTSESCGGQPTVAGNMDGACGKKRGGLGMFLFDSGTQSGDRLAIGSLRRDEEWNAPRSRGVSSRASRRRRPVPSPWRR